VRIGLAIQGKKAERFRGFAAGLVEPTEPEHGGCARLVSRQPRGLTKEPDRLDRVSTLQGCLGLAIEPEASPRFVGVAAQPVEACLGFADAKGGQLALRHAQLGQIPKVAVRIRLHVLRGERERTQRLPLGQCKFGLGDQAIFRRGNTGDVPGFTKVGIRTSCRDARQLIAELTVRRMRTRLGLKFGRQGGTLSCIDAQAPFFRKIVGAGHKGRAREGGGDRQ